MESIYSKSCRGDKYGIILLTNELYIKATVISRGRYFTYLAEGKKIEELEFDFKYDIASLL